MLFSFAHEWIKRCIIVNKTKRIFIKKQTTTVSNGP